MKTDRELELDIQRITRGSRGGFLTEETLTDADVLALQEEVGREPYSAEQERILRSCSFALSGGQHPGLRQDAIRACVYEINDRRANPRPAIPRRVSGPRARSAKAPNRVARVEIEDKLRLLRSLPSLSPAEENVKRDLEISLGLTSAKPQTVSAAWKRSVKSIGR